MRIGKTIPIDEIEPEHNPHGSDPVPEREPVQEPAPGPVVTASST